MVPPTPTDPANTQCGLRILLALDRYRDMTNHQLELLLGYSAKSNLVPTTTRALARDGRVLKANSIPKRADINGVFPLGAAPHVVSVLEPGRAKNRRDPRRDPSRLEHTIALNDALIGLELFGTQTPGVELLAHWHDHHLHRTMRGSVIPDGYVAFQFAGSHKAGFLIEQDMGTESFDDPKQTTNWLSKVVGLLALLQGDYLSVFPYKAITVAVVIRSGGIRTKSSPERLRELLHWTEQILQGGEEWGDLFRFTIADPRDMTPQEFVMGEHWVIPFTYEEVPLLPLSTAGGGTDLTLS